MPKDGAWRMSEMADYWPHDAHSFFWGTSCTRRAWGQRFQSEDQFLLDRSLFGEFHCWNQTQHSWNFLFLNFVRDHQTQALPFVCQKEVRHEC